jgi:putative ABC transport system permease protein
LLVVLTVAAAVVTHWSQLGRPAGVVVSSSRAVLQLALVGLILGFVLRSLIWTGAFLLLMVVVAAGTSAHRITGSLRADGWWTVVPILGGLVPTLALMVTTTVLPLQPSAILPTVGILVGGAMTATSIAGRRVSEELTGQRGSYEAALSLGLTRRDSIGVVARQAASLALVPGADQARSAGVVALPGAFVGTLLAGAPPLQAAAVQVVILVGLLLVQAIAAAVTVELFAAGLLPVGGQSLPE